MNLKRDIIIDVYTVNDRMVRSVLTVHEMRVQIVHEVSENISRSVSNKDRMSHGKP